MDSTNSFEKKLSKKEARQIVYDKLADALVEFKPLIKKKSFEVKIKKATKLFATDIAKASKKNGAKKTHKSKAEVKPEEVVTEQFN